ncbi:hypothetical protein BRY73_24695 [Ochrobactrum sp. P6BS-III]|uniref:hypothetical protein n=1 Tax=unclassified Ochrobactrum TaxID=239106 RepID=UPI000993F010|nr:ElaB/YqjD/DUF883 family membrane-anchored ribosome-binding protein [Ochrobactrum sp. P6BSIII]OOL13581.1 hypothetical protein BRY73_24695 [Ochrobactrum sp. P6BS-III]
MAKEPEDQMAEQIGELRSQLSGLSAQLADRLGSATDKTENALNSASSAFDDVVSTALHQGERVLRAARDNPGAATTAFAAIGIVGVLVGLLLGRSGSSDRR